MKRWITFILTISLIFSLAACGSETAPPAGSGTSSDTNAAADSGTAQDSGRDESNASTDDQASPSADGNLLSTTNWNEPYSETVIITTALEEGSGVVWPGDDDISNNVWWRTFKDRLNIQVKVDWVVPSNEFITKMSLSIASQTLPDVFQVSPFQFKQLIAAGFPADITDIYNNYTSERIKSYLESVPDITATCFSGGRMYAMPILNYGPLPEPTYIFLRRDWMEETGAKPPETISDLVNIMTTFMDRYGTDYGMAIEQSLSTLFYLASAWHAYPGIWVDDGAGGIMYGSIAPEMKNALAVWAEWYKSGIIKQDFAAIDWDAMNEDVINGRVGAQPFAQWWGWGVGANMVQVLGWDCYMEPYEIPSADGKPVLSPIRFANDRYSVVNGSYAHPEALVKAISLYAHILDDAVPLGELTFEELLDYTEDHRVHMTGPFRIQNPLEEQDAFDQIQMVRKAGGDTSLFTSTPPEARYNQSMAFLAQEEPFGLGHIIQNFGDRSAYVLATQIFAEGRYINDKMWGSTPDAVSRYGETLNDILLEGFTKIIMGVENIDYFDTIVANWKAAGGDEATAAINEEFGG